MPYRYFRSLGVSDFVQKDFKPSRNDYFPSLRLSVNREGEGCNKGLFLSLKGGHNAVSHNHLDVGNFVIFCDGQPIFIDAGVGPYTAKTFNQDRYTIWSMRSEYLTFLPSMELTKTRGGSFRTGIQFLTRTAVN